MCRKVTLLAQNRQLNLFYSLALCNNKEKMKQFSPSVTWSLVYSMAVHSVEFSMPQSSTAIKTQKKLFNHNESQNMTTLRFPI